LKSELNSAKQAVEESEANVHEEHLKALELKTSLSSEVHRLRNLLKSKDASDDPSIPDTISRTSKRNRNAVQSSTEVSQLRIMLEKSQEDLIRMREKAQDDAARREAQMQKLRNELALANAKLLTSKNGNLDSSLDAYLQNNITASPARSSLSSRSLSSPARGLSKSTRSTVTETTVATTASSPSKITIDGLGDRDEHEGRFEIRHLQQRLKESSQRLVDANVKLKVLVSANEGMMEEHSRIRNSVRNIIEVVTPTPTSGTPSPVRGEDLVSELSGPEFESAFLRRADYTQADFFVN